MMITVTTGVCPLCKAPGGTTLQEIDYADVWSKLRSDWHVVISDEVRAANQPTETCSLVRCDRCELERFEPMAPGDPSFYAELMTASPYALGRWDFDVARRRISPTHDVVDLGCGDGRFLLSLGRRGGRTVGVDHHEGAVSRLARSRVEAHAMAFDDFAHEEAGRFDVVTSFHTLEHLRDPVAMVRAATTCLRPGGLLLLSMPNRDRTWREEGEPLDRPPHHVTRWGPGQLRRLADADGVRLERMFFEPPGRRQGGALAQDAMRRRTANLPAPLRAGASRAAWAMGVLLASVEHRWLGERYARRGIYGHTMLASMRRT